MLLGGSVLEAIGYRYLQKGTFAYQVEVTAEEFLEMFGATLILRAALAFARDRCKPGRRPPAGQNVVDTGMRPQYNRPT